jgi:hypothetical protein
MMVPLKDKKVEGEEVQGFQFESAAQCSALKGLVVCRMPNVTKEVKTTSCARVWWRALFPDRAQKGLRGVQKVVVKRYFGAGAG